MYDYKNCWIYLHVCTTIGCLKQFSGMCSHADFIHRYSFYIVHACMEIKAKRCCICFDSSH